MALWITAALGCGPSTVSTSRLDPDKREAIAFALSPIDEYRASVRRSLGRGDDEEDEDEDVEDDGADAVVTPLPTPSPVVLAPVA